MGNLKTLGIDLAKNIFQLHGVDEKDNKLFSKRIKRGKLADYVAQLPPCLIGMESCGSANYWARKFRSYGHEVKLMAPQFVKAYVKSNKSDARDAEAICEAVTRPTMRFVPIKEIEHQDVQMLHRVRSGAVKSRTALSNQIRGFLAEYGIVILKGLSHIRNQLALIIEDAENELTFQSRAYFHELLEDFHRLDTRVSHYDAEIKQAAQQSDVCKRLMKVEGIGPQTATILEATITQPQLFKNGRGVAAMLGLVPKQHSSGDKTRLLGITKRGDRYIRTLLIHGARSALKYASNLKTKRQHWMMDTIERVGMNKAAVAVANKNARIVWALLYKQEAYTRASS